jgi:hypothetical protein
MENGTFIHGFIKMLVALVEGVRVEGCVHDRD